MPPPRVNDDDMCTIGNEPRVIVLKERKRNVFQTLHRFTLFVRGTESFYKPCLQGTMDVRPRFENRGQTSHSRERRSLLSYEGRLPAADVAS